MRSLIVALIVCFLAGLACDDKKPSGPTVTEDQTPPARINTVWICDSTPTWADLCWYAVGDDSLTGKATSYDIRLSQTPITESNFDSCAAVAQSLEPRDPKVGERLRITGLDSGSVYFVAIKAVDDAGNWSVLSAVRAINASDSIGNDSTRVIWERQYGGYAFQEVRSIATARDGATFILAEYIPTGSTARNLLVIKVDSLGALLWSKLAGDGKIAIGVDIYADNLGGCYVFGGSRSYSDSLGVGYIAAIDAGGEGLREWRIELPGPAEISAGAICHDGGFAIAGTAWVQSEQRAFLVKLDANGSEQWRHYPFQDNMCPSWGDPPMPAFAYGGDVTIAADGNIILGVNFTYSDQYTITGCGFEASHMTVLRYDEQSAPLPDFEIGRDPLSIPMFGEIAELSDGSLTSLLRYYSGVILYRHTSDGILLFYYQPENLHVRGSRPLSAIPGLQKVVLVGSKLELASSSSSATDDFCAVLVNELGQPEQELVWGQVAVSEMSPVVTVAPDGAVTVAGLRATNDSERSLVISQVRFRL